MEHVERPFCVKGRGLEFRRRGSASQGYIFQEVRDENYQGIERKEEMDDYVETIFRDNVDVPFECHEIRGTFSIFNCPRCF